MGERFLGRIPRHTLPREGNPIVQVASLFNQLLQHFPRTEFAALVDQHAAERASKGFTCWTYVLIALDENVPDHSTISPNRRLVDVNTHQAIFQWVLKVLAERNLLKGNTIGVDATTLEANAALRSIVRRDTGEQYDEF